MNWTREALCASGDLDMNAGLGFHDRVDEARFARRASALGGRRGRRYVAGWVGGWAVHTLTIVDQENLEPVQAVGVVPWAERVRITARDLIAERVALALEGGEGDSTSHLGFRSDADRETVVARALVAFERGRFLLLAGERQLENLDEVIPFAPGLKITFLRLTPLAGG